MVPNNAYTQYKENSVFTASPEELTLMLYNGLVRFILQAKLALEEKDLAKTSNSIIRAEDILHEFQNTLDMQYPISHNLMLLYDYMNRCLIDANIKKDISILEEVLGFAKELRDTWSQAMKIAKIQQPRQAIAE